MRFSPRGLFPGQDKVWAITFTPDGKHALAAVGHNSAVLWDLQTKKEVLRYEGATTIVGAAAFDADGRRARMVAGLWGLDWDSQTGRPVGQRLFPPRDSGVADDRRGLRPECPSRADQPARQHRSPLRRFKRAASCRFSAITPADCLNVACSPDGRLALTGSKTPSAYLWDVATGQRLRPRRTRQSTLQRRFRRGWSPRPERRLRRHGGPSGTFRLAKAGRPFARGPASWRSP